jgi:hypothetical protein
MTSHFPEQIHLPPLVLELFGLSDHGRQRIKDFHHGSYHSDDLFFKLHETSIFPVSYAIAEHPVFSCGSPIGLIEAESP